MPWPCSEIRVPQRGFTLIELLVTIAILAVLAALAGTNLTPIIERWRVRQAVEEMTSTFAYARSEAIKRGGNVTVRKTALDATQCPQGSGTGDWSCGWIVFDDTSGNGVLDTGEETLRSTAALTGVTVKNADAAGVYFQLTRWGEVAGGGSLILVVTSARTGTTVKTAWCVGPGGRVKTKSGATTCS